MDTLYTAHATATAGRNGHAATNDGRLNVELSHPVLPNRPAQGTDPEQLFACGYAACFGGAVEFAAKLMGVSLAAPVKVDASVSLLKQPTEGFTISVDLTVHLEGVDEATGRAVVERAHGICPYSNATKGNIEVTTDVLAVPATV